MKSACEAFAKQQMDIGSGTNQFHLSRCFLLENGHCLFTFLMHLYTLQFLDFYQAFPITTTGFSSKLQFHLTPPFTAEALVVLFDIISFLH